MTSPSLARLLVVSETDKEPRKEMIKMSQIQTIKEMYQEGNSKSEIARVLGISRPTIDKYLAEDDFSVGAEDQSSRVVPSKLDPYKETIRKLLEEENSWFHKQRFTASRMQKYLVEELHIEELRHSYHIIRRYMNRVREELRQSDACAKGTMPLVWHPGEAQGDFGEADYYDGQGALRRGKYFVLSLPYSNVHPALFMPGENCECVCQALINLFQAMGRVPNVIVFDNATGIGRRIGNILQENELFTRFRLHYSFKARFCNPYSGNEKGAVENAVGTVRRNLFVPPVRMDRPVREYNAEVLVPKSLAYGQEAEHYRKGRTVGELYREDLAAMHALPEHPFNAARISRHALDGVGNLILDGGMHVYGLGPSHSCGNVIVEAKAWEINVYASDGKGPIVTFQRLYGQEREQSYDMNDLVSRLSFKPNSWPNSIVREQMPDGSFRSFLDGASLQERRDALSVFRDLVLAFGMGDAVVIENSLASCGRTARKDEAMMLGYRMSSMDCGVSNPTGVDLHAYDSLMPNGGLLCH